MSKLRESLPLVDPVDIGSTVARRVAEKVGPPGAVFVAACGFALLSMRQSILVPATYGMTLAQTMFAVGAVVWATAAFTGYAPMVRDRTVVAAVLAYAFASFISYGGAMARGVPSGITVDAMDRYVMVDMLLVGMVLLILAVVRSEHPLRVVLGGLVLGGTVSALFALVYAVTGLDLAPNFRIPVITKASDFVLIKNFTREGLNRPQGSAGHALELCAVLTVLIPLGVALILSARKRGVKTWPWSLCTAIILVADLASLSRSAVVGGAAAVAVMCWRWPVRRLLIIVTGAVAMFVVGTVFHIKIITALIATFAGSGNDSSLQSRAVGQAFVAENVWKRLWFGQGVGAYPTLKQPVLDNQYLSRLMESGVFGLVAFVVALALALYLAIRASARATGPIAEYASGISGAIAALIVICLILDTSGFMQIWYMTWMLVALAGAVYRLSGEEPPR
ncbi:O-antigen ligase family protein [Tsukamurella ocularis]|uniref:O-antigen ligase family protein n=1 Tax=Tsukamurella ocularis TaxID=1970234 RepID=UPI002167C759|nr:O-antigen ligase family protein [Tsukamurella ocularis]MCS3779496.1 O-antigen ligase [Tsukamurella ocularis]MCS3788031.1 O-antigen ligase [Tsukamurella ocularis]MCS3852347.1 O-antigen ligase [Tsukamurella ocularis]